MIEDWKVLQCHFFFFFFRLNSQTDAILSNLGKTHDNVQTNDIFEVLFIIINQILRLYKENQEHCCDHLEQCCEQNGFQFPVNVRLSSSVRDNLNKCTFLVLRRSRVGQDQCGGGDNHCGATNLPGYHFLSFLFLICSAFCSLSCLPQCSLLSPRPVTFYTRRLPMPFVAHMPQDGHPWM